MSAELAQYLLSGITIGAIYALVALGFSIIFNASHVINFASTLNTGITFRKEG
jgi:branched-chain amino acid transport system permease protein